MSLNYLSITFCQKSKLLMWRLGDAEVEHLVKSPTSSHGLKSLIESNWVIWTYDLSQYYKIYNILFMKVHMIHNYCVKSMVQIYCVFYLFFKPFCFVFSCVLIYFILLIYSWQIWWYLCFLTSLVDFSVSVLQFPGMHPLSLLCSQYLSLFLTWAYSCLMGGVGGSFPFWLSIVF